ncbi:MAG: cytidylate kinase-like family protein [Sporichthyaceae bacterium]|nr:cytidylate kinase-like family protein [Sporichthyaceae bacterium]
MRVVTISAAYGAGGSVVGPAVAERLGVPFVDRAIPEHVAAEIGCSLEAALAHDGRAETGLGRVLQATARMPNITLGGLESYVAPTDLMPEEEFVRRTETYIANVASTTGGVILGRAGAFVLATRPSALHVRLAGPVEARIAQAAKLHGRDLASAKKRMQENDRARAAYVQHFYHADANDPRHYHLVVDSTAIPLDAVTELVANAALAIDAPTAP